VNESRGPWFLITGLLIGLGVGLLYAWVISPVRYVDTPPYSLRADFKDQYRALVAAAYGANGDLGRARARLNLLRDGNPAQALAAQAQRVLAEQGTDADVRAMALLAAALNGQVAQLATPSGTMALAAASSQTVVMTTTPQPTDGEAQPTQAGSQPSPQAVRSVTATRPPTQTLTPTLTTTAQPTRTFTPTQGAPFALSSLEPVCQAGTQEGLLQVEVQDASGKPVPGVRLTVAWSGGQNSFYTGLKPAINAGYADFVMTPGVTYTLRIDEGGEVVRDLKAEPCTTADDQDVTSGLHALFVQP